MFLNIGTPEDLQDIPQVPFLNSGQKPKLLSLKG